MKIAGVAWILWLAATAVAAGEVSPPAIPGTIVERLECAADPSQTYSLYLPTGYDPERRWPVLLVFDPRGRSVLAAELFRSGAERYGWIIVSSNDTRSDIGMEPNRRAVNGLWPEIHRRFPIDTNRVYAAGFSGTVYLAFMMGKETGGVAGIVAVGGRDFGHAYDQTEYAVWGAAGDADFNNREMRMVHDGLTRQGNPNRFEDFEGGHSWMPPEMAARAMEWLEVQAIRRGLRPGNDDLVRTALAGDLERAEELIMEGRQLEAERMYSSIARDYVGLADVSPASSRAAELAGQPEVKRQRKLEERWDAFERRYLEQMQHVFQIFLQGERAEPPDRLVRELGIDQLRRRADRDGAEGLTAQRLLASVFVTTSFYMTRELLGEGRPDHAASVLGIACSIREDDPVVWYNRGCALSLAGRRKDALAALTRAVELGFDDLELIAGDPDLEALRTTDGFKSILEAFTTNSGE